MVGQGLKLAHCLAAKEGSAEAARCSGCPEELRTRCPYGRHFQPARQGDFDPPRPFSLTTPPLQRGEGLLLPGDAVPFTLTLIGDAADEASLFLEGLMQAGRRRWLGRGRRSGFEVELDGADDRHGGREQPGDGWLERRLDDLSGATALALELQSPLCLRESQRILSWFDLDRFLDHAWRRLSRLASRFAPSPTGPVVERPSAPIRDARVETAATRRVSYLRGGRASQGQPTEGIVGRVVLGGRLQPILPLLVAAERFNVGHNAALGLGQVILEKAGAGAARGR